MHQDVDTSRPMIVSTRRSLFVALASGMGICALMTPVMRHLGAPDEFPIFGHSGLPARDTFAPNYLPYKAIFRLRARDFGDFQPALEAAETWKNNRHARVYDTGALSQSRAAFVYPPFAAMVVYPLVGHTHSMWQAANVVHTANRLMWLGGGALLFSLLSFGQERRPADYALFAFAYLAYYPLAKALDLTQAQVWIWMLLVVSAFLLQRTQYVIAGIALGLAMCIKPHLVLIPLLLFFAPGFPRRLLVSSLTTSVAIALASWAWVGTQNLYDYAFTTLPSLSAGYAYYPNQSLGGLLLRLGAYAPAAEFNLAPEVGWIKTASMLFGITLLAVSAYLLRRHAGQHDPTLSLALAITVATLASPVTWFHHFTSLSIAFCIVVRHIVYSERPVSRRTQWLALVSFVIVASHFDSSRLDGFPLALLSAFGFYGVIFLLLCLIRILTRTDSLAA